VFLAVKFSEERHAGPQQGEEEHVGSDIRLLLIIQDQRLIYMDRQNSAEPKGVLSSTSWKLIFLGYIMLSCDSVVCAVQC
jgi:hypothetical protein